MKRSAWKTMNSERSQRHPWEKAIALLLTLCMVMTMTSASPMAAAYAQEIPATYAVTVSGGAGSGDYEAGATVAITADTPDAGNRFTGWSVAEDGITLADSAARATSFTMPGHAVTITANTEPWLPSQGEHYTIAETPFTIAALPGFAVSKDAAAWASSAVWGEEAAGGNVSFFIMNTATGEISGAGSAFYPLPEAEPVIPMAMGIQAQASATASMGSATISGIVGEWLPGRGFSVSLEGDTVKEELSQSVVSWFNNSSNFPSGVSVDAIAEPGGGSIMFYFVGIPASESSAEIGGLSIPGSVLSSGQSITVSGNPDTKFNITFAPEYPETPTVQINGSAAIYTVGEEAAALSVSADVSDGGELSYQWYVNGGSIGGATSSSHTPSTSQSGEFTYYCVVTNTNNIATISTTEQAQSGSITITVQEAEVAKSAAIGNVTISGTVGEPMEEQTATITLTGDVCRTTDYIYNVEGWFTRSLPDWMSVNAQVEQGAAQITLIFIAYSYPEDEFSGALGAINIPGELLVEWEGIAVPENPNAIFDIGGAAAPENAGEPVLDETGGPQDATYTVGDVATPLTVSATSPDGGALSYIWYKETKPGFGIGMNDQNSATFTPPTDVAGTIVYYCGVTNTNNNATTRKTATVYSTKITITVNDPAPLDGVVTISVDPATGLLTANTEGVTNALGEFAYKWEDKYDGEIIAGGGGSTLPCYSSASGYVGYKLGSETTLTVTAAGNTGSLQAKIEVCRVALFTEGDIKEGDSAAWAIGSNPFGVAGDVVTLNVTVADGAVEGNGVSFRVLYSEGTVTEVTKNAQYSYTISPSDVVANGIIQLLVSFAHEAGGGGEEPGDTRSASMGSGTITGEVGARFLGDQTVVITLANEATTDALQYVDASGWFADLPATGLDVTATYDHSNDKIITLIFEGTPTAESTAALGSLTIPGQYLASGNPLPVDGNPDAVFAIAPESTEVFTATIGDFTATGTVGNQLAFFATVTMTDTYFALLTDMAGWFTGLPANTEVRLYGGNDNTIIMLFIIDPIAAFAGHFGAGGGITMTIPGAYLSHGKDITVSPNASAKITITGADGGIVATPETIDFGSAEQGYTELPAAQVVTFTNTSDRTISVERIALGVAINSFEFYVDGSSMPSNSFVPISRQLGPSESIEVAVQPRKGLEQGEYTNDLGILFIDSAQSVVVKTSLSFNVTPARSASMGSATISGEVGAVFLRDQTVTITLANDTVANDPAYADASGWFTDLPDTGLEVRAMVNYQDGVHFDNQHIMLKFSGRPTAESTAALGALVIPGQYLASGKDLPVAANPEAVFAIGPESTEVFTATISDFTAVGSVGAMLSFSATLTATDTLLPSSSNLTDWFTGLPAGMEVWLTRSGVNESVLTFIGSPTSVSAAHFGAGGGITMTIPGEDLAHGKPITVSPNPNAKFIITGADGGMTATPETLDFGSALVGYTELPAEKTVTITNLGTTSIPLGFIRMELPETSFSIVSTALPGALDSGASMQIAVQPKGDLAAGEHTNTLEIGYTDATGEITLEIPLTFTVLAPSAAIGDATISGTAGSVFVDQQTATITLENDTLKEQMQDVDAKAWAASFTASGLNVRAVGAKDGNQIELQFSGRPPIAYAGAFGSITIPGTYLTSGKDLVVTENENATFSIVEETRGAPSATICDVVIRGRINDYVNATATITLENDVMAHTIRDMDVSNWFSSLPDGVNVTVSWDKLSDTITLLFSGTAHEVSAAHFGEGGGITMRIPGGAMVRDQGLTVSPNPDAKFIITGEGLQVDVFPKNINFGVAEVEYAEPPAQQWITLTNIGEHILSGLDATVADVGISTYFTIGAFEKTILYPGEYIKVAVQPKPDLPLGTYTSNLRFISFQFGNDMTPSVTVPLTFTVALPPSAAIGDATISGTAGSVFVDQQTATITLENDTLKEQMQDVDAKAWAASFTASGLNVRAVGAKDGNQIELQFSGRPPVAYAGAFGSITIPGTYLTSGKDLLITENASATFAIAEETRGAPSATISDVVIRGSIYGNVDATATVTLENDVMAYGAEDMPLNGWFYDLPRGVNAFASFSAQGNTITLKFAGRVGEVSAAHFGEGGGIALEIKAAALARGQEITVSPNPNAKFIITGAEGGITATPNSLDFGSAPLGYQALSAAKMVTITNLGTDSIPLDFIRLQSSTSNFSFTPTELPSPLNSGESIQITVQPVDGLTLGNHTNTLGIQYRQGAIGPKTLEIPLTFTVENTAPQPKNPVPTQYIYVPNSSDTVGHTAFVYASEIAFGSDDIEIVSVNTGSSSKVTGSVENGRAVLSSVALGEQQVSVTVQNSKGETQISVPVVVLLQPRDVLVIGGIASKSDDVPPGEVVTVLANASEQGKRFTGFTADLESLAFSKRSHYEYSFVMPEQNVTITANYETWNLTEGVEYTLPTGGTKDAEGNIDWVGRETILINRVEGYQITNRLDMGFADQVGSMSQSTIDGREVTLYAQNTASGEISAAKTLTFYQDLTAPATPTLAGARGHSIWEINPVTLTVSASDALSGIASFEYTLDAEGSWSAPIPWNAEGDNTFTISDSGSYANSIHVRVSDAAGNTATSGFYTVQLNTEPLVGDFSIGINPETGDLTAKRTTGLWHNWSGEGVINSRTDTLLREAYTLGETITLTLTDPYTHQGAQINVVVYTVTFDGNGNGGSSMVYCFKDLAVAQPDNPARTGHTFKGWSTDATVYSAYDFDTPITAATTLYAHWTLNTYKIFFELNGGSWEVPYPTEYTYGTGMYFFPAPVKDDHYFDGWFAKDGTSTSNWGSLVTSIGETDLGDKTVYAKWTERTYTAAISVMKDDLAWHQSNSGKAFTLIHDSSKAEYNMEARKGLYVYEAVVPNGTYSVFNGSVDTGVDITIYRASNDATINYYTITFGATPAGVATTGASITTATYGGAPIDSNTVVLSGEELILIVTPSGADGYAYLWSGAGVPADQKAATLTIGNLSGTVNATCTVTGGDSTAPTGSISIGGNSWTAASTFIPYELFYKEAVTVTIAATDNIDEEVKVEYRIVEKSGAISNWITYSAPFTIDVGSTAYILARFTDDSGNETRINSSGVVVYEDAQQDTEAIAFTKFSLADVSASVMLNGNTIAGITNGEETLVPGEDYTVSGGIITFKASYLDSLVASDEPYTLTIAYNPRGEAYVDTEGNDAPATTTIALDVLRYGIAPPVANQPLTENGEVQVGVPTGMGYDVWGGRGSEPGTYMAVVELNQNYQWLDGTTRRLSITWEILEKKEPAKNTRVLVSPFVPANDPDFMDFMGQRTKTRDTALLYEAKLVDTRTLAEFKLPIGQTFLLKLIHPQTDEAMHVLLRENKDGTFDCVLVNVDIKEIKYPITDFTRYGIAPDEEYIEGVEPHSDMELNGWVYWVWTLDAEELVLRIEN